METRTIHEDRDFAALTGYTMLDPNAQPLAPKLSRALDLLKKYNRGSDVQDIVQSMGDEECKEVAKNLSRPLKVARETFGVVADQRRVLWPEAIATLRSHGRKLDEGKLVAANLSTGGRKP